MKSTLLHFLGKQLPSHENHGELEVNHLHCLAEKSPIHQTHSVDNKSFNVCEKIRESNGANHI